MESTAPDEPDRPLCRFCFEADGELIEPCGCQGTARFVHLACLRRWQHAVVLSAPNNPHAADADAERRHLRCGVCLRDFNIAPPSRLELVSALVGPDVASALARPGSLIVASRRMSERAAASARLPFPFSLLAEMKQAHWRRAVYLVCELVAGAGGDGTDAVVAINLTREVGVVGADGAADGAAPLEREMPPRLASVAARGAAACGLSVVHHNGGPVKWSSALTGLLAIPGAAAADAPAPAPPDAESDGDVGDAAARAAAAAAPRVLELGDGARVLVGAPEALLERAEAEGAGAAAARTLRTFSGYAQWSHAQLLGEIARGDWGVWRSCLAHVTARAGAAEARAPAPDAEGAPPPALEADAIDDLWGRALASGQVSFPMGEAHSENQMRRAEEGARVNL